MSGSWDAMLRDEEQRRISSQAGLASIRAGVQQSCDAARLEGSDHEVARRQP